MNSPDTGLKPGSGPNWEQSLHLLDDGWSIFMGQRYAQVKSRTCCGIDAPIVRVEAHITTGMNAFTLVGMPATMVKESRHRIRSALLNSGFRFPHGKITINLAPASVSKQGGHLDLAMAIAILLADNQLKPISSDCEFIGELGLDGSLHSGSGLFNMAYAVRHSRGMLVSAEDHAEELNWLTGLRCCLDSHLRTLCDRLENKPQIQGLKTICEAPTELCLPTHDSCHDQYTSGQVQAMHMLRLMAAGNHHGLMIGPPGSGKTHLAQCLPILLPPLTDQEACEVRLCYGAAGANRQDSWWQRPYRCPHHSASAMSIVGGGRPIRAGEITLAHHGILFLDELPEFHSATLDMLRQPLEQKEITLTRVAECCTLPCQFQLLAAMNPCPCGYHGSSHRTCRCSPGQAARYLGRISGPLLDRLDCYSWVAAHPIAEPHSTESHEPLIPNEKPAPHTLSLEQWKNDISKAREIQQKRQGISNSDAPASLIQSWSWPQESQDLLQQLRNQHIWDKRAVIKLQRLARTVADLDNSEAITPNHLMQALSFRQTWPRLLSSL